MASQPPVAILDIGPHSDPRSQTPNIWDPDNFSSFEISSSSSSISTSFLFFITFFSISFSLSFFNMTLQLKEPPVSHFLFSTPSLLFSPVEVFLISYYLSQKPNFMHIQKIYSSSVSTFQFHVFSIYTPPTHPNSLFEEFDKHF